ncbi:MAG: HU family DNA-binding protein [Candidatus Marinimicrobia bacterium]|nr:HU family DNA-binding protein [Candidatus Neomarinimicrobiota bacterium]MCF7827810.1 HU family DNA-binding protein [Candidatus Neomarinimicrobiota bacterium]MCF7879435.1 HU family DNA-binding protein [Candidatus Neomarinimicrobiota bacterium]
MTRQELIQQVAEAEGVNETEAEAILDEFLDLITDRIKEGQETLIYGFGKFGRRWWKSRTGRDPQTGEEIEIEGRWIPYWTPSDTLIREGKSHPAEEETEETAAEQGEATPESEEKTEEQATEEEESGKREEEPEDAADEAAADAEEPDAEKDEEETSEETLEERMEKRQRTGWEPPVRQRSSTVPYIVSAAVIVLVIIIGIVAFRGPGDEVATDVATDEVSQPVVADTAGITDTTQAPMEQAELGAAAETTTSETKEVASVPERISETPEPATATSLIDLPDVEPYEFGTNHRQQFLETYDDGLRQFQDKDYLATMVMMQRLQISDPPVSYADNVQYWIGECKFGLGRYREAIREFEKVFLYPNSNKNDDALIMMASSYLRLREYREAQKILFKFQADYQDSQYAPIALKWINQYNLSQPLVSSG